MQYRLVIRPQLSRYGPYNIKLMVEEPYKHTWLTDFSKRINDFYYLLNMKYYLLNKTFNIEYNRFYFYQFYTYINEDEYANIKKIINTYNKDGYIFPNLEETGAVIDVLNYRDRRVPYIHIELYINDKGILNIVTSHKYHKEFFDEFFKDKPFKLCTVHQPNDPKFTYHTALTNNEVFALAYIFQRPLSKQQAERYLNQLKNNRDGLIEELALHYCASL